MLRGKLAHFGEAARWGERQPFLLEEGQSQLLLQFRLTFSGQDRSLTVAALKRAERGYKCAAVCEIGELFRPSGLALGGAAGPLAKYPEDEPHQAPQGEQHHQSAHRARQQSGV